MGGEFFLRLRKDHKIEQKTWEEALRRVVDTLGGTADTDHRFDGPEYAFEFEDPAAKWGGDPPTPKTFRLAWQWGPEAIQSELGGRRRSDWSTVGKVCKMLCDHFPGRLALVVCDGMSGYEDDLGDMFYDGIICASCHCEKDGTDQGLVSNHAYSVLGWDAEEEDRTEEDKKFRQVLVHLRNPWGWQVWRGKWSNVDAWHALSRSLKSRVLFAGSGTGYGASGFVVPAWQQRISRTVVNISTTITTRNIITITITINIVDAGQHHMTTNSIDIIILICFDSISACIPHVGVREGNTNGILVVRSWTLNKRYKSTAALADVDWDEVKRTGVDPLGDGSFYMSLKDFWHHYRAIQICTVPFEREYKPAI
ncbi:unnamed protein product [Symbiodinium necroappetens]|uniref:Calpain catalytic domain-containing protein n=1 Tax=Symbiodinium necroappetens TaxID=1628268 RepID=A0A812RFI5_9DINO|nr:unnamed protein product [Symbiodinium necroappetens]